MKFEKQIGSISEAIRPRTKLIKQAVEKEVLDYGFVLLNAGSHVRAHIWTDKRIHHHNIELTKDHETAVIDDGVLVPDSPQRRDMTKLHAQTEPTIQIISAMDSLTSPKANPLLGTEIPDKVIEDIYLHGTALFETMHIDRLLGGKFVKEEPVLKDFYDPEKVDRVILYTRIK